MKKLDLILKGIEETIKEGLSEFDLEEVDGDKGMGSYYDGPKPKVEYGDRLYKGYKVEWVGVEGETLKMNSEYVSARSDNIFDFKKMKSVTNFIKELRSSGEIARFDTPLAEIRKIDRTYMAEIFEANERDALFEYGIKRHFTFGDENLDLLNAYLYHDNRDFAERLFEKIGMDVDDMIEYEESENKKDLLKSWEEDIDNIDEFEYIMDQIHEYEELKENLKEAIENDEGDHGKLWAVLRDGNHRTFGAIESGEDYVYVRPTKQSSAEFSDRLI